MHVSGLLTLALNIAEPLAAGHYGRAAVDAVAPLLLLGWGAVGPQLLRAFHTVTTPTRPRPGCRPTTQHRPRHCLANRRPRRLRPPIAAEPAHRALPRSPRLRHRSWRLAGRARAGSRRACRQGA